MTKKSAQGSAVERNAFASHVRDQLAGLAGTVAVRPMFGGFGVTLDGLMFGLIDDGVLYLKVDDENRAEYTGRGLRAFTYPSPKGPMETSYHRAPDEALDDADLLCEWARKSVAVALRKKKGKAKPAARRAPAEAKAPAAATKAAARKKQPATPSRAKASKKQ